MSNEINQWNQRSLSAIFIPKVVAWWKNIPPDPWPEEIDKEIRQNDGPIVCHRCFTPHSEPRWFCEECGTAIGPYNNIMPYIRVFSTGEVARAGVQCKRYTPLTIFGFAMFSTQFLAVLFLLIPVFAFRIIRNYLRQKEPANDDYPTCDYAAKSTISIIVLFITITTTIMLLTSILFLMFCYPNNLPPGDRNLRGIMKNVHVIL